MPESKKKSLYKTITWRIIAIIISIIVTYAFTGMWMASVGAAIVANGLSMVAYYGHERVWSSYA